MSQRSSPDTGTTGKSAGLKIIFDESFLDSRLPDRWYTDTPQPQYEHQGWNCQGWDGVIVPLPHDVWQRLSVEVELTDIGAGATAFCGTDARTSLSLALNTASPRHQAADGNLIIRQSSIPIQLTREGVKLVFEWTAEQMQVTSSGVTLLAAPNLRRSARAGSLQMGFSRCHVKRITALGQTEGSVPAAPKAIETAYPLEVTVDFNDDLMACPWTHKTFESLFTELKSWGTRTVSWIDLGRSKDEYLDFAPLGIAEHARETVLAVGEIFAAAVDHAHRHDIKLIGLLKPYDMAINDYSWPPFSKMAKQHGRIARIGTSNGWATRMATDNQHLLMARKPAVWGPAKNTVWTRLDLVKDDDDPAAFTPEDIVFTISDDNETFRPYAGPISRRELVEEYPIYQSTPSGPIPTPEKRRSRVFRFEGIEIRTGFFAIEVNGKNRSFANRLCDLVHIYGENGEETRLTYGLTLRQNGFGGFEFNRYPGAPSNAMISGGDPIITPLTLDRGPKSFIAFARGKDRSPLAVMSPSFPETRALWMGWVKAMLDAGADGIDIRPGHHHADFAWIEYGFEEPVRAEMLRRTGVDIWETDEFDTELWRRIRGDGWTQFIREASAVVRGRDKTLAVHIDNCFDSAPGTGGAMNLVCDWRSWLQEGLVDRVTGRGLWPDSSYAREVLELAHAKGITVTFAPYCNNFFEDRRTPNHIGDSPAGCTIPVERLIKWGRQSGYDSFLFHECASALRAAPDGTIYFRANAEPLGDILRHHFKFSKSYGKAVKKCQ